VADNTTGGGPFGAGVASIDRSNGYFNQIAVQSDYAYISVQDTVNGIFSDVFAYTHSLSLGYASAPSATIEEITLSDYGIKNTITGTFSIQDVFTNDLLSVSDTGTVSIYGLTNSTDTNVVTWNSTTKELGYRTDLIELKSFEVTIPSAQVLTLNSSPVTLVPAQGAGLGIELICASGTINYNSVPYDTNTQMRILCQTGSAQANFGSLLLASSTQTRKALMTISPSDVGQGTIVADQPLQITVHNGEALNGDSSLVIRGLFRVIQVP
jgi:hypothetical protein